MVHGSTFACKKTTGFCKFCNRFNGKFVLFRVFTKLQTQDLHLLIRSRNHREKGVRDTFQHCSCFISVMLGSNFSPLPRSTHRLFSTVNRSQGYKVIIQCLLPANSNKSYFRHFLKGSQSVSQSNNNYRQKGRININVSYITLFTHRHTHTN